MNNSQDLKIKSKIWQEQYRVTSFLVNLRGQAGLHSLLNFIQDVGWQHAVHMNIRLPKNQGWVFTRQKLQMNDWPKWNEVVHLRTWLRQPVSNLIMQRDYEIFVDDRLLGQCTSTFSVIDLEQRKLAPQDWTSYSHLWADREHLIGNPDKIQIKSEMIERSQFQVRHSDLDLNNHVNNTKYAQWILDSLPLAVLQKGYQLRSYQVNFTAEAKSEDVISIQQSKEDLSIEKSYLTQFQGIRCRDQKIVFLAELIFDIEN